MKTGLDLTVPRRCSRERNGDLGRPDCCCRYQAPLGQRWSLKAYGDVGGFGVGSHLTWQMLEVHYQVNNSWSLSAAGVISTLIFATTASYRRGVGRTDPRRRLPFLIDADFTSGVPCKIGGALPHEIFAFVVSTRHLLIAAAVSGAASAAFAQAGGPSPRPNSCGSRRGFRPTRRFAEHRHGRPAARTLEGRTDRRHLTDAVAQAQQIGRQAGKCSRKKSG